MARRDRATAARTIGHDAAATGDTLVEATVDALAETLGLRDGGTGLHSRNVGELACGVGRRLGLGATALRDLRHAARLHDIGKVGVSDAILRKPGPLLGEEWEVIREHSAWGAELVGRVPGLERVARIVRHHHERWDGSGYPDGLAGKGIPLESRTLCVADAWEAMTSDRPYRGALPAAAAARELMAGRERQFDPACIDALLDELGMRGPAPTAGSPRAGTSGRRPARSAARSRPGP